MGLRFRKLIRILPGVRVNVAKRGVSASVGRPGTSINVGKRGAHVNVGVPGSGVSYRQKIGPRPGIVIVIVLLVVAAVAIALIRAAN
jgi:hypothetical protein